MDKSDEHVSIPINMVSTRKNSDILVQLSARIKRALADVRLLGHLLTSELQETAPASVSGQPVAMELVKETQTLAKECKGTIRDMKG